MYFKFKVFRWLSFYMQQKLSVMPQTFFSATIKKSKHNKVEKPRSVAEKDSKIPRPVYTIMIQFTPPEKMRNPQPVCDHECSITLSALKKLENLRSVGGIPSSLLPASTMVAGKCNSQKEFSDPKIRNLRQVIQLRRR